MPKILIVEDNENDLYLSSFILRHEGYEIVSARDADDGIRLARSEKPDLIFTDLSLGVPDGYHVIRTLKAAAETRDVPIVAISVFVTAADLKKAFDAGCEGFIEKPFVWETLVQQTRTYLRR